MGIQRTKYKNISKIDRPDHHMRGYLVRVKWNKQLRQKFCSLVQYKDWMAALDAALEFRDQAEKELGKPRTEQLIVGAARESNTGIRGIRFVIDGEVEAYEATWVDHTGRKHVARYAINRYGKRKALKLAQEARERGENERRTYPRRTPDTRKSKRSAPDTSVNTPPSDAFEALLARAHNMPELPGT